MIASYHLFVLTILFLPLPHGSVGVARWIGQAAPQAGPHFEPQPSWDVSIVTIQVVSKKHSKVRYGNGDC